MTQTTAFIGLGSNLNTPHDQLDQAINRIAASDDHVLLATGKRYQNPAMTLPGTTSQPDFINTVIKIHTQQNAEALLVFLKSLESQAGRDFTQPRWSARALDCDILLFGDTPYQSSTLMIPHPGLANRAFVLQPLFDIAPNLSLPGGESIDSLLDKVDKSALTEVDPLRPDQPL